MMDGRHELIWRKSRACATNACVEVAWSETGILVRDSKNPDGQRLAFGSEEWSAFIAALRRAELDS